MTDGHEDEGHSIDWDALSKQMSDAVPDEALQYIITPQQLRNRVVRDVVMCKQVPAVFKMLGLPASSPDVEEMEHRESHSRLDAAEPLQQAVGMMSMFAAEAATAAIMDATGGYTSLGSDLEEASQKLQPVLFMAAIAILAELIDAGHVHLPHNIVWMEQQ